MLADFFTKALQGTLFCRFRDGILGHSHIDTLKRDPAVPLEERVEGKQQPGTRATALPSATSEKHPLDGNGKQSRGATWANVPRSKKWVSSRRSGKRGKMKDYFERTFLKQSR
jgi:hypothetical protein